MQNLKYMDRQPTVHYNSKRGCGSMMDRALELILEGPGFDPNAILGDWGTLQLLLRSNNTLRKGLISSAMYN